jgi:starch synthase
MVCGASQAAKRRNGVRILFASAEFAPLVRVGGLAEAASGLVRALRAAGIEVEVVVPDYFATPLEDEIEVPLDVPRWAAPAIARRGTVADIGEITLVSVRGIERPNPYVDDAGTAWPDNADRFFAFSAAVAALAESSQPDVLHCNDWHTALALGFVSPSLPAVLTLHNVAYQGWTSGGWIDRIRRSPELFEAHGGTNPVAGAISLADKVIAVSPNHADEIRTPEGGSGLHEELAALGPGLIGIRNGIDTTVWNPATDPYIAESFSADALTGKQECRRDLLESVGWDETGAPIVGMVGRLVAQKGIELALDAVRYAEDMPFRLVLLGSGERGIADRARDITSELPDMVFFHDGYDVGLGHKIFAGCDILLMPSHFEPCGLAQMQAMEYGTIPVVTGVGGLVDTVGDADSDPETGSGFVARSLDDAGVVDAMHRAVRAWKSPSRWAEIQRRGMVTDWSWAKPAHEHIGVYEEAIRRPRTTEHGARTRERSDGSGG